MNRSPSRLQSVSGKKNLSPRRRHSDLWGARGKHRRKKEIGENVSFVVPFY